MVSVCAVALLAVAQTPAAPTSSGTVTAVDAQGMATVKLGDKQQTVQIPKAQVGDQVECKEDAGKWQCTVKPK
jgi:hypothetical protein